jgi:hypothetical protein
VRRGQYLWIDAVALIDGVLIDGTPDEVLFWRTATAAIMQAARGSRLDPPRVAACGEGVPELLRRGGVDAAIRLEQWWDDVSAAFNVDIFCGYAAPSTDAALAPVFEQIRAAHTSVVTR